MYEKIVIDNFRCFEHLEVGPLARVNLITGANNVGKTALLEAVYLFAGQEYPITAARLAEWRGLPPAADQPHAAFASLVRGFSDETAEAEVTGIRSNGEQAKLRIVAGPRRPRRLPSNGRSASEEAGAQDFSTDAAVWSLMLEVTEADGTVRRGLAFPERGELVLVDSQPKLHAFGSEPDRYTPPHGVFVPSRVMPPRRADAERLSKLLVAGDQGPVLDLVRLIEPRLREIVPITPAGGEIILHARLEGEPRLLPVAVLGDGLVRLLSLALAMSDAAYGVLLVDEIENGIYHKLTAAVWRGLARAAKQFGVQLFATTHSYECVQAAVEAFQAEEFKDDLALHRLDRLKDGSIKATTYDGEAIADAVELNWEVR